PIWNYEGMPQSRKTGPLDTYNVDEGPREAPGREGESVASSKTRSGGKSQVFLLAIGVSLAGGAPEARGMGTEKLGNAPVTAQPGWPAGVLPLLNLPSRAYSRWVNGNESFYFRGGVPALNEALARFAAVDGKSRELII